MQPIYIDRNHAPDVSLVSHLLSDVSINDWVNDPSEVDELVTSIEAEQAKEGI